MNKDQRLVQGTPEWLEFRRQGVFASDSPVIMGVSPWKTILDLYWDKIKGRETIVTPAMQRGKDLEPEARNLFQSLTGHFVFPDVIIDEKDPWLGASLDGINDEGIIVEIKTPGKKDHELALSGKIPDKYYPQLQHQMWVCRVTEMYYFSYSPTSLDTWALVKVYRNDEYLKDWYERVQDFYQNLMQQVPPLCLPTDKEEANESEDFKYCEECLSNLLLKIKTFEEEAEILQNKLIELCHGKPMKGNILKVSNITRKGSIDYKAIPELKGIDLEPYRQNSSSYWKIDFI